MFEEGIYEQLISNLVAHRLSQLDGNEYFIGKTNVDKAEASKVLSIYLVEIIRNALISITGDDAIQKQIELSNKIIQLIGNELSDKKFDGDLIDIESRILTAIFRTVDANFSDFERHLKEITPYSRLTHTELFTGSNVGISMESEIKKEILSSDRISFLVSFIKWTGIRIFERELTEFTKRGGQLRVITTSYMGATDQKAVDYLASLPNTEIKVSYNTESERLHAKAYLFQRSTGFHTAYIGSSNMSRSALTNGLEWNLKVTTKEVGHVIDKFQKTFETYWEDRDFEIYDSARDTEKLSAALKRERRDVDNLDPAVFFDIKPFPFQAEVLEKLETERTIHGRYRNLVVAATGTGKTLISAFDFKNFRRKYPDARLLFVAHREEILKQARSAYCGVLRDNNFGQLWVGGFTPDSYNVVFASVQTLKNNIDSLNLSEDFYDFIVIDEVHHIVASSYRPILDKFIPRVLLGLTATPERMDGGDVLEDFCGVIAAEIRLPEALNRRLLCPFQYFGVSDSVDIAEVSWRAGRYDKSELSLVYTSEQRVGEIIEALKRYVLDINNVRALCFCVTQDHARFMADKFNEAGLKSGYLVSSNSEERSSIRTKFERKEINYLFVVDIFSEGVDIPSVDTVLFLRPTESLTVFLQQLGRGLRLHDEKDCLTVLDFVGNSRPEYDFEGKFRALIGRTNTPITKEIENDFPHLPLGCTIVLEKYAKNIILENIRKATTLRRPQLVNKIRHFHNQTTLPLTLRNFSEFNRIPLQEIYKRASWKRLCVEAGILPDFSNTNESEITRAFQKKWLSCASDSYFNFVLSLANKGFAIDFAELTEVEKAMCLMLHYDIWHQEAGFPSLEESIRAMGRNPTLTSEIIEFMELLEDRIDFLEHEIDLGFVQPLKVHGRYTREQILTAFGLSTFDTKSSNREGNAIARKTNTELLFVTLNKSEENFSPTTLYEDFAISEDTFHWQTHNAAGPDTVRGRNYIEHEQNGRQILLFVRERNTDEFGNAMGSVFLGKVKLIDYSGSKPMNIKWKLDIPMPPFLWREAAKMVLG